MSGQAIEHTLPDRYYSEDTYATIDCGNDITPGDPKTMVGKAQLLQSLLDKWDSLMNDPSIPEGSKQMFKAVFMGKMDSLKDENGLADDEGFMDVLSAIESGDIEELNEVLVDTDDMDELFDAFGQAYQAAAQVTDVKPQTEENQLAWMYMTNDWAGLKKYKLEQGDDNNPKKDG